MISKFVLLIYFGNINVNPTAININFEDKKLCESERKRVEQYYYSVGFNNVKGICVQTQL